MAGIKDTNRKTIMLPSGAEVSVRALTAYDQVLIVGDLPSSLRDAEVPEKVEENIREFFKTTTRESYRITRLLYLRAVTSEKFVDKHPAECGDNETSIYEPSDEDFAEIIKAVDGMKKVTKEDAEIIRPFSAES